MNDIVSWIKEIQQNKRFAQKYKGIKNIEKVVKLAKKDGYEISKSDLEEVSGGGFNFDLDIIIKKVSTTATATGQNAIAQNNSTINM